MPRPGRSDDWGFPRWRSYGDKSREAAKVRLCDRVNCTEAGNCPAPKAPNSPERWYFCEKHAAEYNKNWNYFQGLTKDEAARRAADESRDASGFRQSAHYEWAGSGDGSRSRDEMRALDLFGLDTHAEFEEVRKVYRARAKELHPDVNPGDEEAAAEFQKVQAAYDVLKTAQQRREALG